jgi:large subunit ribosomal protein L13
MKTYSAKPGDIDRKWYVIDADGVVLGRMASIISMMLRGKHKPMYTPHMDCGDHIIVVNADKVLLTGRKMSDKIYYWHTGHPGGIKSRTPRDYVDRGQPERVVQKAVQRMMPRGPLGRQQLTKLKVYGGVEHPHEAQSPQPLDVAAMNPKNKRSA